MRLVPGGGAVWDIAMPRVPCSSSISVALACDDGCVRFVAIDSAFVSHVASDSGEVIALPTDPAHYVVTSSEMTKARVLSVAWVVMNRNEEQEEEEKGRECIVCGDAEGGLRWIDPRTGRLYGRGKVASLRGQHAMIWTVRFTREGRNVVCGDSRGMVTVWASDTNTLVQELQIEGMKGAIWTSTVVDEGADIETVFFGCAGGGVGGLRSPAVGAKDELWVPLRACHFHTHDVRGMDSFPNGVVVSGSFDARMCVFTSREFVEKLKIQWVLPYPSCVGQPPVQFCRKSRLLLSRRRKGIDIWSIPERDQTPLLKLRMKLRSLGSDLVACAISDDARFLSASDVDSFRLYLIWDGDGELLDSATFGKVRLLDVGDGVESLLKGALDMRFCGEKLVCITRGREQVVLYENGVLQEYSLKQIGSVGRFVERITCSEQGVAVCDSRGELFFAAVRQDPLKECSTLLWTKIFSQSGKVRRVTALAFSPSGAKIAIATCDMNVHFKSLAGTEHGNEGRIGPFRGVITSLSFSAREKSLVVSGESFCCITPVERQGLKKRKHDDDGEGKTCSAIFTLGMRDSILGSCAMDSSRLVVIRRPWNLVQSSLPEAIPKKPFGT